MANLNKVCRECGNILPENPYIHKGAKFCSIVCAKCYWNYMTDGLYPFVATEDEKSD